MALLVVTGVIALAHTPGRSVVICEPSAHSACRMKRRRVHIATRRRGGTASTRRLGALMAFPEKDSERQAAAFRDGVGRSRGQAAEFAVMPQWSSRPEGSTRGEALNLRDFKEMDRLQIASGFSAIQNNSDRPKELVSDWRHSRPQGRWVEPLGAGLGAVHYSHRCWDAVIIASLARSTSSVLRLQSKFRRLAEIQNR